MSMPRLAIVLSFDSEGFALLEQGLRLSGLGAADAHESERRVFWYDSPDYCLAGQGVALAILRQGGRGRGATTELTASAFADYARQERPIPPGEKPSLADVSDTLRRSLFANGGLAVFAEERLSLRRVTVGKNGEACTVDFVKGWIDCKNASHPVHKVVLEGAVTALSSVMRLARLVANAAPCDLHLMENEAALGLAAGYLGKSRKARKLGLGGVATVNGAFGQIVRLGIEQIAGNHVAVFSADTVEGVHQMRVGVRRLRSTVNLFRSHLDADAALRATGELKELAKLLGPIRDGDVFKETILDPPARLMGGDPGMARLLQTLEGERETLLSAAHAALDKQRFTGMMLDLLEWSLAGACADGSSLQDFAFKALGKRHRKLTKAGKVFAGLDPLQRHALRILGKKMRYAGEFLFSLYEEEVAKDYLGNLSALVDVLGHLNDIAVARRALDVRRGESEDAPLQHAVGFVEGWHAGRSVQLEQDALAAWEAFKACRKFWK